MSNPLIYLSPAIIHPLPSHIALVYHFLWLVQGDVYAPEERGMAMGNMMGPVLIGPVIAPLVGGALAQQVPTVLSNPHYTLGHALTLLSSLYPPRCAYLI